MTRPSGPCTVSWLSSQVPRACRPLGRGESWWVMVLPPPPHIDSFLNKGSLGFEHGTWLSG